MKTHLATHGKVVDSHKRSADGAPWSLQEKLLLGMTPQQYIVQAVRNPFNWILAAIFAIGLPLIAGRFFFGLSWVTHSSNDYPWGLFLGFGLFAMVPLSASGFMLGTTVEIFGRHDFKPIERLALLNGLLGYLFAVIYLLVRGLRLLDDDPLEPSPLPRAQAFEPLWMLGAIRASSSSLLLTMPKRDGRGRELPASVFLLEATSNASGPTVL